MMKFDDKDIESENVVNYWGCLLDNNLTGEFIGRNALNKICGRIQLDLLDVHT